MSALRLLPLGGLGAIGGNCLVLEHGDDLIVVDCGISFSDPVYGVDVVIPDLSYVRDHRDRVRAIVITHGHEDHIGALPYLLDTLDCPVFAPPYALELVRHRLAEHQLANRRTLIALKPGASHPAGVFRFEAIPVEHSIPDAHAMLIETPQGVIVHTGDYRWSTLHDANSPQRAALEAIARRRPRLLLSDSTNILRPGHTHLESSVAQALERWVIDASGRVVFTTFVSNIERLQSIVDIAHRTNRYICLLGRSTLMHTRTARELGLLKLLDQQLVAPKVAADIAPEELLIICGGSQGEPHSALARLARDDHNDIALEDGDRVILSSRTIPGNEQRVIALIDQFERMGVDVVHQELDPAIHTSGHGYRDELKAMLETLAPQCMMPVHGRYQYLRLHADLARSCGIEHVMVASDGDILELDGQGLRKTGTLPLQSMYLSADRPISLDAVRERVLMARVGLVVCTLIFEARKLPSAPRVSVHGLCAAQAKGDLNTRAATWLDRQLRTEFDRAALRDATPDLIQDTAKRLLRRFFTDELGLRPVIDIVLQQR